MEILQEQIQGFNELQMKVGAESIAEICIDFYDKEMTEFEREKFRKLCVDGLFEAKDNWTFKEMFRLHKAELIKLANRRMK